MAEAVKAATEKAPVEEVKVESVSAINATDKTVTVTLSKELTAEELAGKKLTLTGANATLTANFKSVNGKVVTFEVAEDIIGKAAYNGDYTVATDIATVATGTKTTYTATISDTKVEGFVYEAGKPAANIKVVVGSRTVTTDANGYYSAPAESGLVKVAVQPEGNYFITEDDVTVQRNSSTVFNAKISTIVTASLLIEGTVVDPETGNNVQDAKATLEKLVDGEWVKVAAVNTTSVGKYTFANSGAGVVDGDAAGVPDTDGKEVFTSTTNFKYDDKLRVVISKDITATNLDEVHEAKTVEVTLNNKAPKTSVLTELRPIKEIKSLDLKLSWADLTGTDNDADFTTTSADVALLATDGKTVLVARTEFKNLKADGDKEMAEAKDLADTTANFFMKTGAAVVPTIPTGTYYLRVNDGVNAIAIIPVSVTEGGEVSVAGTIEKARSLSTATKYGAFIYNNAFTVAAPTLEVLTNGNSPSGSGTPVTATFKVFKTVNGVDVLVTADTAGVEFEKTSGTNPVIQISKSIGQLAEGSYTVVVESDYVKGTEVTSTATIGKAEVVNHDITVQTASTLTISLKEKAAGNAGITSLNGEEVKVELLDADDKVVSTTTEEVTAGTIELTGVTPTVYKVRVTPTKEYKAGTSESVKVFDIQDQTVDVLLEAIEKTVVGGYIKDETFTDIGVGDATVIAYNEAGHAVAFSDVVSAGKYEFANGILKAGETYKFVVRGNGFETAEQTVTVTEGQNTPVNFKVKAGGQGLAKFIVTDTAFKNLSGAVMTAVDSKAGSYVGDLTRYAGVNPEYSGTDGYYADEKQTVWVKVTSANNHGTAGPDFDGFYDFPNVNAKVATTATELSAGSYTFKITDYGVNYKDYAGTFTIANVNGNFDGPAIQVELTTSELVSKIKGTVDEHTTIDYVVAYDKDGKIVDTDGDLASNSYTLVVPNNATYTVSYYANGKLVSSRTVSVQDYDVTGINITTIAPQR